ncbi:MAG: hypothetical protein ACYDCL_22140 [Myxococcales bacterium]
MRSTVILDDDLFKRAKQRAAELGTTLSEIVNQALRLALATPPRQAPEFRMVTYGPKRPIVHHEPADLDAALEDEGAGT